MTDKPPGRRIVFPAMGTAAFAAPAVVRPAVTGDDVPSPCVDICRMDDVSGLCEGCARTLDEIAGWSQLGAAGKRRVIAQLPARRAALADPFGDLDTREA